MTQEMIEEAKDLNYWKNNAKEDYLHVPISVLRYISELEKQQERSYSEEDLREGYEFAMENVQLGRNGYEWVTFEEWFEQFKNK